MDEVRDEVRRLKREELKARLKGVPFVPTDEEKSLLEKGEAEMYMSTDDTPIIIPPTGGMYKYFQDNILDTKEESIELPSQDMMKKKRDELRQKGIFDYRNNQITTPQESLFNRATIQEQWILNETVKVLFDNESLMKLYLNVYIPEETGQNIDDFDDTLKQRREELRKRLLSNKKSPLNNEDDFSTIVIPRGGSLS